MKTLSDALRAMLKAAPESRPADLDAFLAQCDAVAYAPAGSQAQSLPAEVHERALALARSIEEGAQ